MTVAALAVEAGGHAEAEAEVEDGEGGESGGGRRLCCCCCCCWCRRRRVGEGARPATTGGERGSGVARGQLSAFACCCWTADGGPPSQPPPPPPPGSEGRESGGGRGGAGGGGGGRAEEEEEAGRASAAGVDEVGSPLASSPRCSSPLPLLAIFLFDFYLRGLGSMSRALACTVREASLGARFEFRTQKNECKSEPKKEMVSPPAPPRRRNRETFARSFLAFVSALWRGSGNQRL